jgi:NADH-quinone oxidoreductase E subunit
LVISEAGKSKIEELKGKYPDSHSVLLPALDIAQREAGYLSPDVLREVAAILDIEPITAASVASFYTMFNRKPVGKYLIQVCTNLSCSLMGAEHIVNRLRQKLGIDVGETTPDGRFTLMAVECLGSCGTAPMMQINDDYYENLTEARLDQILAELAAD